LLSITQINISEEANMSKSWFRLLQVALLALLTSGTLIAGGGSISDAESSHTFC
jgi:hypothetical protein